MKNDDDFVPSFKKKTKNKDVDEQIDKVINGNLPSFKTIPDKKNVKEKLDKYKDTGNRVKFAHEIKTNPPEPGFMNVDVPPAVYSIDLNIDAHWWFNHVCTVFPLLLDQAKRTATDIKDSFKPEKRLPDFPYVFIFIVIISMIGVFVVTKVFGWW